MLEENPKITNIVMINKLSEQTGFGLSSVKNIILEYKRTGEIKSPNKKKMRMSIKDKIDEFDKNAIRRKVHGFYFNRELPTLDKVLQAVNEDNDLPDFKRTTFYKLLKDLNFSYVKRERNSILTEREDLIVWRRNYLKSIRRYWQESRTIYYLDETWVNAIDVSSAPNPSGKGKRLIELHIGSEGGFVPGALLCFESKKNTADYHDEMNGDTFLEWFTYVLPALDQNSVIVMDNAPYHSVKTEKIPNMSWTIKAIVEWIEGKGIEIGADMVKAELLQIVQKEKHLYNNYVIDKLAKKYNKEILRLPSYHCELNPIEMVWSMVKQYVKSHNTTFKVQDVKKLLEEGIANVTAENWTNFIRHVIKEEDKFFEIDHIVDDLIDEMAQLVINVTGETESSSNGTDN
ncbi:uncharacterized protein [Prorops nasuta]|uniref:uncharacterized protein n=1 Tax=Prorops nasuta TaxID=863751 RepID=UPI0034CF8003